MHFSELISEIGQIRISVFHSYLRIFSYFNTISVDDSWAHDSKVIGYMFNDDVFKI